MIVYKGTLSHGASGEIQKSNLILPSAELERAADGSQDFVFLSRSCVFDLSKRRTYDELSVPNAKDEIGKTLAIMERKVLDYERGFVVRARHVVSDILPQMMEVCQCLKGGSCTLSSMDIFPTSDESCDHVSSLIVKSDARIIHVPSTRHSFVAAAVRIAEFDGDFDIADDGIGISEFGQAIVASSQFAHSIGAVEMVDCIHANEYYVNLRLYGD